MNSNTNNIAKQRAQNLKYQKTSFISQRNISPYGSQQLPIDREKVSQQRNNRISEQMISQQKKQPEFLNIFEDDDDDFSAPINNLEGCQSSSNLRINFKNNQWNSDKNKKLSIKGSDSNKLSLKSVSQQNLHLQSSKDQGQFLHIKLGKSIQQDEHEEEEQNQNIKAMKQQIKRVQQQNQRTKEQNLQLRLKKIKLSANSETMTMLSLKAQVVNLKKKIAILRGNQKDHTIDQNVSQKPGSPVARTISRLQHSNVIMHSKSGQLRKQGIFPTELQILHREASKRLPSDKLQKIEHNKRFVPLNSTRMQGSFIMNEKNKN